MGIDAMRIRVQIKRFLGISIRTCYKSVRKHPFLVGFVCFLIFLYRSFPFLFSLLVSASPILVCTAILLGTLLSFGEPNIPEIEKDTEEEEEATREISFLKAGVAGDATVVVGKDENFFVERFLGKRKDTAEEAIGEDSWEKNGVSKIEGNNDLGDYVPLVDESSREIKFEKQLIEVERDIDDLVSEKKREINKEKQGTKNEVLIDGEAAESHSLLPNGRDESVQIEDDKYPGESVEAEHTHFDSQHSSWKRASDDDEEEDQEASDSGSDGAESSSPDASMADIIPMLDELHPLLHEGAPQPAHMSEDGSDVGSEESHNSNKISLESDEDIENQADEEEDGDDDNDNEEGEEEVPGGKEDESKSAIKWTEDDQKNLMDLGTSELERNLRLESLIARRRARRSMRVMPEKNLIDLDGADLPLNIPTISTTRHNPFDLPYDPFDDVPGSAPSILLPRHNPFDLPYDSNEEKPDLKGDSFQQEFSSVQHKETLFRRHESFNVGPSVLGAPRQDVRWKPYFVPERFATEETSYRTFHRQLSEISESKLSSVPDTESVNSALEEEDKKINEEDDSQETEMISSVDHASVLVQRGSLSSEDVDSLDIENIEGRGALHDEDEITLGDIENHHELDSSLSTLEGVTPLEVDTAEILLRMEPGEEEYSSRSSVSSLSEVDEKICDVKGSLNPQQSNVPTEESHISMQSSLNTEFHFMSKVADENQHREIVLEPRGSPTAESVNLMHTSFDSNFHFTSGVEEGSRCMEPVSELPGDHIGDSGISLETSLDSGSRFTTGVEDNNQHQDPPLELSGNHISDSGISMQTSLSSVSSGVTDCNQHKEPVYDSSPQAVDKLLSFLSISSDTQGEASEMDSTPTLDEFAGKESGVHIESTETDASGYKESHEGSSQERSLDENKSRSGEVVEFDQDVMKVGLARDDLNFDRQNGQDGFMKQELGVERDAVDSPPSSSGNGSVKEGLVYNEKGFNGELDQPHSSSLNGKTIVVPHQNIEKLDYGSSSNQVASAETILHALEEQDLSVAHDVSVDSNLSSSMSESLEEHVVGKKGILHNEQDQIPSSVVDAEIHVDSCQAMDGKLDSLASGNMQMPSDDLKMSANEERQPVVVAERVLEAELDASSSDIKDVEEISLRKEENLMHSSSSDATIAADFAENADMKLISSGSNYQHMFSEAKSPFKLDKQLTWSDKVVVEPSLNNHDKVQEPSVTPAESTVGVQVEDKVNVPEVFDRESFESTSFPQESIEYKSKADEIHLRHNILDKIVYEDNGHSLEGPSYSAEAHRCSLAEENIIEDEDVIKEIDEGLLTELDSVGDFWVKGVVGESLHDEQMQTHDFILLSRDSRVEEITPELPVLEVRSVTDIDKQLHGGVDVEEVIVPSVVKDHPVDDEFRGPEETNSDLQATEASSLEDAYVVMKQVLEGNTEDMLELSDLKEGTAEAAEVGSSGCTKELPVLEIRTINDIDLAFKQLSEGVDVEEVILPSAVEQHVVENDSGGTCQSSFDLPVVEARSLEDLHVAMKEASEKKNEEMSKTSDSNEGPAEVNEVGSSSSTKDLPVLEVRTVDDIDMAFKQLSEGVDFEELILPSTIEQHAVENDSGGTHQSSFDLPVVEARSLEDLYIAMKEASEKKNEEMSKTSDSNEGPVEVIEVGSSSSTKELPILEVRTVDDFDLAFKQLSEGVDVEEEILPSMSSDPQRSSSDLQVLEPTSKEELLIATKQVPKGNTEELPESSNPTEELVSRTSEVNEMGPVKDIESSTEEAIDVGFTQESGTSTKESGAQISSIEASH